MLLYVAYNSTMFIAIFLLVLNNLDYFFINGIYPNFADH